MPTIKMYLLKVNYHYTANTSLRGSYFFH